MTQTYRAGQRPWRGRVPAGSPGPAAPARPELGTAHAGARPGAAAAPTRPPPEGESRAPRYSRESREPRYSLPGNGGSGQGEQSTPLQTTPEWGLCPAHGAAERMLVLPTASLSSKAGFVGWGLWDLRDFACLQLLCYA